MTTTILTRHIEAPVETVFTAVADIDHFSAAVPHITEVEFLSERRSGVGTRFRETRLVRGREATNELEVTEYVEDEQVRFVSNAGGTLWDTTFTTEPREGGTLLTMRMEARPQTLLARLMTPLMKRMIKSEIEKDLDLVKSYCEHSSES